MMGLVHPEPQVSGLDKILVAGRWFDPTERYAVLMPQRMADGLGIDPAASRVAQVRLWGMPFSRWSGLFSDSVAS